MQDDLFRTIERVTKTASERILEAAKARDYAAFAELTEEAFDEDPVTWSLALAMLDVADSAARRPPVRPAKGWVEHPPRTGQYRREGWDREPWIAYGCQQQIAALWDAAERKAGFEAAVLDLYRASHEQNDDVLPDYHRRVVEVAGHHFNRSSNNEPQTNTP